MFECCRGGIEAASWYPYQYHQQASSTVLLSREASLDLSKVRDRGSYLGDHLGTCSYLEILAHTHRRDTLRPRCGNSCHGHPTHVDQDRLPGAGRAAVTAVSIRINTARGGSGRGPRACDSGRSSCQLWGDGCRLTREGACARQPPAPSSTGWEEWQSEGL
eukprot:scaffold246_cov414-Prasinococcus_capsulatus_cf.AAC.11